MQNALVTISIGDTYKQLSAITHPILKRYADKIGADFIVIDRKLISTTTPHFEKFQISSLLNKYKRIIFMDTDLIIRPDCPNLFEVVPEDKLGAFNEGAFMDRSEPIKMVFSQYQENPKYLEKWEGRYFNTGVMVISRRHKFLFVKPATEVLNFYEQSYLNMQFMKHKIKTHELPYKFNRMTVMDKFTGEHRLASYIVHYAGCPDFNFMLDIMQKDINQWQKDHPKYEYQRNILIQVHGGLGDEICAEPIIRHIIEKAYPTANIRVVTWFPRLFVHLPVPVYQMGEFKGDKDVPYYTMDTLAPHNSPAWKFISANLLHTTDYSSIMCLRKIIPDSEKIIKLQVLQEDEEEVKKVVGDVDLSKCVLVHPGKGWASKTFPVPYWNEIIEAISKRYTVIVIGKDISDDQGSVPIKISSNVIDSRNLLGLGGLIAIVSKAHTLVSNDSSPIHIAGAFDNHIVLLPSCKHPDHVLPYRGNANRYHKAVALYKKLTCEAIDSNPTNVHGQTIDYVVGDILDYLPNVENVVKAVDDSFKAD